MHLLFQSKTDNETINAVFIGLFILGAILYFTPSIIAIMRAKKNLIAIMALNFFLGWSLIGWVISLVWSLSNDSKPHKIIVNQQAPVTKEDNIDKLTKLKKLLDDGTITQEEFGQQKATLLKNQ